VGEPKRDQRRMMRHTAERLPSDRPRYLMGVGTPEDIARRSPRHRHVRLRLAHAQRENGWLFTRFGDIKIRNARYRDDTRRSTTPAPATPARISRAATCITPEVNEILGARLNTLHNLHYYHALMRELRGAIAKRGLATASMRFARHAAGSGKANEGRVRCILPGSPKPNWRPRC